MATSGSYNYSLTAQEIINEALRLVGVLDSGEDASADDTTSAMLSLNLMLKTWGAQSRLWLKKESAAVTLTATTQTYTLAADCKRVLSVRRRTSSIDTPLNKLSREEYFDTPSKAATGMPVNWYADDQRTATTLYIWPTASTTTAASTTLYYTYVRIIEDVDALTNEADVPQEWFETVVYNLAVRLGPKFGASGNANWQEVKEQAAILYANLTAFDQEDSSIFIQPAYQQ